MIYVKNGFVVLRMILVTVLLLLPQVCSSFQPKVSTAFSSNRNTNDKQRRTTTTATTYSILSQSSRDNNNDNDNDNEKIGCHGNIFDRWYHDNTFLVDKIIHQAAAIATASAIMMMGPTILPVYADTTIDTIASTPPQQQQQSLLLKEVSSPVLSETKKDNLVTKQNQREESSVVKEVWNLLDKYYIDRSFNKLDWNKVRNDALIKAEKFNFDNDNDKSMKIIYEMVGSLNDKYTRVLDVDQYAAIQKYDLIGVGVTLMPNSQKDIIVGAPPIAKSAGDNAGLKVGDLVTAVNGVQTRGRNAFDIIDQISENPDSKTITFSIIRNARSDGNGDDSSTTTTDTIITAGDDPNVSPSSQKTLNFDVTMNRQTMAVKDPVQYKITETRNDGTKVGYVRVSEFNTLVNSSLQKAMSELNKQGANAYVLDLRGNTGGAFQSAVEISGLFLRDRVATYVVDSYQVELPFRTPKVQDLIIKPETPMVIWLDGLSASASEVLAGSLHDNCRAVTMGDKSYGKGLIQAVYGLKNGAGLVVTVARYVTPNGNEIQGVGITPDILPLGKNMPAPVFVPILSTDTSKVDFNDVAQRLNSKVCHIPEDRVVTTTTTASKTVTN